MRNGRTPPPEQLLDFQPPLQGEVVCRLLSEENFTFLARSPLNQTLHKLAHFVLSLDLGAETAKGSDDRKIRVVDVHRSYLELQNRLARHGTSRSRQDDLAENSRACGNHGLSIHHDIVIQSGGKSLAHLADP